MPFNANSSKRAPYGTPGASRSPHHHTPRSASSPWEKKDGFKAGGKPGFKAGAKPGSHPGLKSGASSSAVAGAHRSSFSSSFRSDGARYDSRRQGGHHEDARYDAGRNGAEHSASGRSNMGRSNMGRSQGFTQSGAGRNGRSSGNYASHAPASRFSRRQEGQKDESTGARQVRAGTSKRKEIVAKRASNKPGFTAFQLRLVKSILHSVLVEKKPLDKAYALWFTKVKIPAIEQGFVIRNINAMFRRLSFYAHIAGLKRPSDFERHVNRLIFTYYVVMKWPLPELNIEGLERAGLDKRVKEAEEHPLYREGCPFWLEELGSRELKEAWANERKALGEEAPRFIRTNTLKVDRDTLASRLSDEGVVTKSV